jgi:tetratricopeptide (TPR) repeat protein
LALATAGAYLSQSADSFVDYLHLYNSSWDDLSQYSSGPVDYEERTLYSTWNVSFEQVQEQDPAAAELLKLMAFLDNQDLWYKLFQAGAGDAPAWWVDVLKSQARFNRAISTLHNYSLLEVSEGRYSLHTCVHDWTLEYLNHQVNQETCGIAIRCVAASVSWESEADYWVRNRRVLPHARRFQHVRLQAAINWGKLNSRDLSLLADLYRQSDMNTEAERMYILALRGKEKAWGPEHTSTLATVNNLGLLYADQGRMAEAEEMYERALRGYEKALGKDHPRMQTIAHNLQGLYACQ